MHPARRFFLNSITYKIISTAPVDPVWKSPFSSSSMDPSVRFQDDPYQHAVGSWKSENPVPKSKELWRIWEGADQALYRDITAILTECATKDDPESRILDTFYTAGMDISRTDQAGASPIDALCAIVNGIQTHDDIFAAVAQLQLADVPTFFGIKVKPIDTCNDKHGLFLTTGGLTLKAAAMYTPTNTKQVAQLEAYAKKILCCLGWEDGLATEAASEIVNIEKQLAEVTPDQAAKQDPRSAINTWRIDGNPDWQSYFSQLGASEAQIFVNAPPFFNMLPIRLKSMPLKDIKAFLIFKIIDRYAPFLATSFQEAHFQFHGQQRLGKQELPPRNQQVIDTLLDCLGSVVDQKYESMFAHAATLEKIRMCTERIRQIFIQKLEAITWLTSPTKMGMVEKLKALSIQIGFPPNTAHYAGLVFEPDLDYCTNLIVAKRHGIQVELARLKQPVTKSDWSPFLICGRPYEAHAFTSNAFYRFEQNKFYLPWAMLQPPFINEDSPLAHIMAIVGFVTAHELTHAIDSIGSQYDVQGNLGDPWIAAADQASLTSLNQRLIAQLGQKSVNGVTVDGKLALSETIADTLGLEVAYSALDQLLNASPDEESPLHGLSTRQAFFIIYAQFWARTGQTKAINDRTKTNEHPPEEVRASVPLANCSAYYDLFNVTESDGNYVSPEARYSFFS